MRRELRFIHDAKGDKGTLKSFTKKQAFRCAHLLWIRTEKRKNPMTFMVDDGNVFNGIRFQGKMTVCRTEIDGLCGMCLVFCRSFTVCGWWLVWLAYFIVGFCFMSQWCERDSFGCKHFRSSFIRHSSHVYTSLTRCRGWLLSGSGDKNCLKWWLASSKRIPHNQLYRWNRGYECVDPKALWSEMRWNQKKNRTTLERDLRSS